jgi:hypothetical protein
MFQTDEMQEAHVSIDRMQEVVRHVNAIFTPAEEEHVRHCENCLLIFTALMLEE